MTYIDTFKKRFHRFQEVALCLISKWWRPILYVEYVISFGINLIFVPLMNWQLPDLNAAATYLAAGAALSGLRTLERIKGVARGQEVPSDDVQ